MEGSQRRIVRQRQQGAGVFSVIFCIKKMYLRKCGQRKLRGLQEPKGEARPALAEGGTRGPAGCPRSMGCGREVRWEWRCYWEQNLDSSASSLSQAPSLVQSGKAASEGRSPVWPLSAVQAQFGKRCAHFLSWPFSSRYWPVSAAVNAEGPLWVRRWFFCDPWCSHPISPHLTS